MKHRSRPDVYHKLKLAPIVYACFWEHKNDSWYDVNRTELILLCLLKNMITLYKYKWHHHARTFPARELERRSNQTHLFLHKKKVITKSSRIDVLVFPSIFIVHLLGPSEGPGPGSGAYRLHWHQFCHLPFMLNGYWMLDNVYAGRLPWSETANLCVLNSSYFLLHSFL